MNKSICRFVRINLFLLMAIFTLSSYCGASSRESQLFLVGEYGYVEKYDSHWNLLAKVKVSGLVGRHSVRAADISPDGELLFLAVSKKDSPLIVLKTEDLSVDKEFNPVFPPKTDGFVTYSPTSLISVSSRYLYMADESYSGGKNPFMNIMIDLKTRTTMPISKPISLDKDDVRVSPEGDRLVSRGVDNFYTVDVPSGSIVNSIDIPPDQRGNTLAPFHVDWEKKIITVTRIKSNNGQSVEKLNVDMLRHTTIQEKNKPISIADRIKKIKLLADEKNLLIEDDKDNVYIMDIATNKILDKVDQSIISALKGYDFRSDITPDNEQLICLKDDIEKRAADGKDITHLLAVQLKTKHVAKYLDFPEKLTAVLSSRSRK